MADQEITKQPRDRSPNWPYMSLPLALERAKQFYEHEKRAAAPVASIAKHWSYSPKSSGLIQSIAAMKSYGLMDEEGRGQDRRLRLSELALRIILDQRPDSPDRAALLRRAAAAPNVVQRVLDRFPHDLPSDHTLEHFLIFDLSFNPETAKAAVKLFKENALFTGIYDGGNIPAPTANGGEPMESSPGPFATPPSTPAPSRMPVSASSEQILGPDGAIALHFAGEPSWESYDFLENYIKLRKSVLKPGAKREKEEK